MIAFMSSWDNLKLLGLKESNFSDSSLTALSPFSSMSFRVSSTMLFTFVSISNLVSTGMPGFSILMAMTAPYLQSFFPFF